MKPAFTVASTCHKAIAVTGARSETRYFLLFTVVTSSQTCWPNARHLLEVMLLYAPHLKARTAPSVAWLVSVVCFEYCRRGLCIDVNDVNSYILFFEFCLV